jgi:hypothetical protein
LAERPIRSMVDFFEHTRDAARTCFDVVHGSFRLCRNIFAIVRARDRLACSHGVISYSTDRAIYRAPAVREYRSTAVFFYVRVRNIRVAYMVCLETKKEIINF